MVDAVVLTVVFAVAALLLVAAAVLAVPVAVLVVEVWSARRAVAEPSAAEDVRGATHPRTAVLVPAHNEALGIAAALATMRVQLGERDRLLVVADNCTDATAAVAAAAGAEVAERHDSERRGKGYALDHGVRHLQADPPDVVVIVDADCVLHPGALQRLATECLRTGRPVQALYLMRSPAGAGLKTRVAEFAWLLKNQIRPSGMRRLGGPCPLMGTGMAFPWVVIHAAPLATGHLVEDMQLGIDLARAGTPPLFCAEALVTSEFPIGDEATAAQRTRWEHGHLGVIAAHGLPTLWQGLRERRTVLTAMALDLCVPPLTSLVLAVAVLWSVSALLALIAGALAPVVAASGVGVLLLGALVLAWWRYGRAVLSPRQLAAVPAYVLGKLPIYAKLLTGKQVDWIRTKRDGGPR